MPSPDSPLICPPRFATPRHPDRDTLGPQVAKVAQALGTPLMPWQQHVADVALEIDPDTGRLAYRELVLTVPRQSGKTTLILALAVHRAIGFDQPQRITYTAQTRNDARMKWEDDHVKALDRSLFHGEYRVRKTNGNEAILWRNGSMHGISATTEKAGHGATLDMGFIDEAFAQVDARVEQAMRPAMITRPQPQLVVTSTAGTPSSVYLNGKVDRGRERVANDPQRGACYMEWSAPDGADLSDPDTWRACMPALGHTVTLDAIRAEFDSMERAEFARAYGNRRAEADTYDPVIPAPVWESSGDTGSRILDPVAFAVDVAPDRSHAAIVVAGSRDDGRTHVELVEYRPGTGWVAQRVEELAARWSPRSVVVDNAGPAASLIPALEELDIPLDITGARDMASACGMFYDTALADQLRHIHQAPLTEALLAAQKRPLGDSWAWSRKGSTVDISPLVAATLAVWGHSTHASTTTADASVFFL